MSNESFFRRWAKVKSEGGAQAPEAPALPAVPESAAIGPDVAGSVPQAGAAPAEKRLPTLDAAALLTAESDYSTFVAQGVDKSVQRLAMKKLFSDPHFNVLDGLDIYMGDYNQASPVSAVMLAGLQHAESFFASATEVEAKAKARLDAEREKIAAEANIDDHGSLAGDATGVDINAPALASDIDDDGADQLAPNHDDAFGGRQKSIQGVE